MRPLAPFAASALLLLTGSAARAAEGMPQLDFANPLTLAQVVWGALIFLALYFALAHWALPQVAAVLESRAATITGDLDAARYAKTESDIAAAQVTEATRQAHASAQAEISGAVAQAKAQAAEQAAALNARLDAQLASAEQRIAAARASALGALREVAASTTAAVVTRLTGQQADMARIDSAVGAALAARARA